jgi:hypothetical protein
MFSPRAAMPPTVSMPCKGSFHSFKTEVN